MKVVASYKVCRSYVRSETFLQNFSVMLKRIMQFRCQNIGGLVEFTFSL
jgi:hypothetical protein